MTTGQPIVPKTNDRVVLSVRINLPSYSKWRLSGFIKQYPYLAFAIGFIGVLSGFLLFGIINLFA